MESLLVSKEDLSHAAICRAGVLYLQQICIHLWHAWISYDFCLLYQCHLAGIKSVWTLERLLYATLPASSQYWVKWPNIPGVLNADGRIFRLRKSLYGLLQAPKLLLKQLGGFLLSLGLTALKMTQCATFRHQCGGVVYLLVYMNDILLFSKRKQIQ